MTQPPSGNDPVVRALDELVRAGQLEPSRAQAAYEASRGTAPTPLRLDVLAVAVGTTLIACVVALSATHSRKEGDLDWSNFGLGILATIGLLGVAAAALVLVKDDAKKANLVAWPGAIGALGVGSMIAVAMDDNAAAGYVAGIVTVALSVGGFVLVRRGAFVIAAVLGLYVTYANLVSDLFDVEGDVGDNIGITVTAALLVFAVLVTAGGWALPTRHIGGVFVGAVTAAGFVSVLAGVMVAALVQQALGRLAALGGGEAPDPGRFDNDVYVIVAFTVVLVAGWAVCGWLSGHVGYRVLILVTPTAVVPLATVALGVEHPSYWGLGLGVLGAAVLGVFGLRAAGILGEGGRRTPPPAPGGGGPIDLDRSV